MLSGYRMCADAKEHLTDRFPAASGKALRLNVGPVMVSWVKKLFIYKALFILPFPMQSQDFFLI
jgi:hypothetical protein